MKTLFSRIRTFRSKCRSQAFSEFAIILPIFLTVMCGVIDYGYMVGNAMILSMAAREGANSAARQFNDPLAKGLAAAVNVAKPRVLLNSSNGGGIITRVVYLPNLATNKAYLSVTSSPSDCCVSTGGIFGGDAFLKNKSRILEGTGTWNSLTRKLPMAPSVLDPTNQVMTVMEVFYTNQFVTPIGTLIGLVTPSILYDSAFY